MSSIRQEENMLREIAIKTHNVLDKIEVEYFLIGRAASSCWGVPTATANIDIVIVATKAKIDSLLKEFKNEGFAFDYDKVKTKLSQKLPAKLTYKEGYSIDLRIASYTIDYEAIKRVVKLKIFNKDWNISPPEELIIYKLLAGKPKDWDDIRGIMKNKAIKLDWKRMEYLAKTLANEYNLTFINKFKELQEVYKIKI